MAKDYQQPYCQYHMNLDAHIQSLCMALSALHMLEDREGNNGKKTMKNNKSSDIVEGTGGANIETNDGLVDVIDKCEFVDGVKVAHKCSKANILDKAIEYIWVSKIMEQWLKNEQAGLKTLISGLVGGPALVRKWGKEWWANFGGKEKDEVEGNDKKADDNDSNKEDDNDSNKEDDNDSNKEDGDDGDEEGGRKC